jgi:hypothetical protein
MEGEIKKISDKIASNLKVAALVEAQFEKTIKLRIESLTHTEQLANLKIRMSPHISESNIRVPDFQFPAQDKLDWNNPIVGFTNNDGGAFFNVIMKDGSRSRLNFGQYCQDEHRINPVGAVVRRVVLFGHVISQSLYKIEFYDKDNTLLLRTGSP